MAEFPSSSWKDYELLDSGAGEKLERFGAYVLARPEPKALWDKSLPDAEWRRLAHTTFTPGAGFGKAGKEDSGTWNRLKKMDDQWYIDYANADGLKMDLRLGLTSFKHVGVFPEQAPNWDWIYRQTRVLAQKLGRTPRVLNLFAYTGAASLAAKAAGRLPGAQPLFQRLLRPAGRDGDAPGHAHGIPGKRRTCPERPLRQGPAPVHRRADDAVVD